MQALLNLANASKLGSPVMVSTGSKAYIKMNGPVLNIVDKASSIALANNQ